jgi:hypothetical protein
MKHSSSIARSASSNKLKASAMIYFSCKVALAFKDFIALLKRASDNLPLVSPSNFNCKKDANNALSLKKFKF